MKKNLQQNKIAIVFFLLMIAIFPVRSQNFAWGEASAATCNTCGPSVSVSGAIAVDVLGNVYTTGSFNTSGANSIVDFDPGPGTYTMVSFPVNVNDVYVTKVTSAGNFVWAKKLSSTGADNGYGIAADASGNVYVAGTFQNTLNCDPNITNYTLATVGSTDIFIVKFNSSGNFVWAKQFGSTSNDQVNQLILDAGGNVLTVGNFMNTVDFDPGPSVNNVTSFGGNDGFISKLDPNGNFVWIKQIGGPGGESISTINQDANGNILTAGGFGSFAPADFDPGPGTYTMNGFSGSDVFISKLDASGNFVWAKQLGGPNVEIVGGVTSDPTGNVYTTGFFNVSGDYDPGPATYNLVSAGGYDAFISKLDASGNFVWAKRLGGPADDAGGALGLDPSGNVYSTGTFSGTSDFDPGASTFNMTSNGRDIYISKLDASGNFVWAGPLTTNVSIQKNVADLTTDILGNIYVNCDSPANAAFDCDPGPATYYIGIPNGQDAFVVKLSTPCSPPSSPGAIAGNVTICNGSSQTYSIAPVSGATSYTWTLPGGWTGTSTTNIISTTVNASSGNLSVSAVNSCSTTAAQILSVTVNTIPSTPASVIGSNTVCSGNVKTYSVNPVAGATLYTWVLPGGWTGTSTTNIISTTVNANSGTISASASNGCGTSASQTLNVVANVTPTISVNSGSICSGKSFTMIASGANTYTYQGGNPIVSPLINTSYTVIGTSVAGCISASSATANVTVSASPTITVNSGSICNGQSFTIVPSGASTYTFSSGPVVSPPTTSNYSVTGTATNGCISTAAAVSNVTVNPLPFIAVNSGSICSGNSFTLSPVGASTYTYLNGGPIVSPTVTTSYSVIGTSAAGCVSSNTAVSGVTVNTSPLPTITVNSGSICAGSSFTMIPGGANTYTFQGGNAVVSPTTTSSYTVIGTNTAGCLSALPATCNLLVSPAPNISANTNSNIICIGQSATLTASGASTYTWNPGGAATSIVVSPTTTTLYSITGTDANGCTNSAVFTQSVSTCTEIVSISKRENDFKIYPNPTSGFVNITGKEGQTICVYNSIWEKIISETFFSDQSVVDLSTEANGIYFIRIGTQTKKIIKN